MLAGFLRVLSVDARWMCRVDSVAMVMAVGWLCEGLICGSRMDFRVTMTGTWKAWVWRSAGCLRESSSRDSVWWISNYKFTLGVNVSANSA